MVKDYFVQENNYPITPFASRIISPINQLIDKFRKKNLPVIFSTDAFNEDDFMFQGKMHPHAIKGTKGAEVIDELNMEKNDLWLPKPRFSAFFDTDLEKTLNKQDITMCAIAGIATNFCVLTTAMDAICFDFKTVILEDCSAAFSEEIHEECLNLYRKNPLYPLFRVMNSSDFAQELNLT
ncbi:MAG: cysteine hydrolase [Desulfobacteraceae bacterium]|nr:cysteine hydrolase [Desulfobacteraceae bacterium]